MLTDASCDVQLWDVHTRKHKTTLKTLQGNRYGYYAQNHALTFSPDGKTLVSTGLSVTINVRDVETEKHKGTLKGDTGIVTNLEFSEDGTTLMNRSGEDTALFWEMRPSPVTRLNITPNSVHSPLMEKQLTFLINMVDGKNVSEYQFTLEYDAAALRFIADDEKGQSETSTHHHLS